MKILYFHQHFSTPLGSTGIRSYQMARKLTALGHSVTIVCGSYKGAVTGLNNDFENGVRVGNVDGIDVIELLIPYSNSDGFIKRSFSFLRYAFKGISIALREDYDLIFTTSTPLTAAIPGIFAHFFRRKIFVFEVRDLWPELPKAMGVITNPFILFFMSCLEWLAYKTADRCVALSPGIAEGIRKRGVADGKISVIPNGCDLAIFENAETCWRPTGVGENDFLALFCGTHGIANGLDAILNAALELKNLKRNDIKFVLVGQGKLKKSLMDKAKELELENVIFHDPVDKVKLAALMNGTDIGLQVLANVKAFYYGTSPNKFFDYISAGLPVLINYPGWLAEYVESENCGFYVVPDDPTALAKALITAADDKQKLLAMGRNARLLANRDFSREVLSERWVEWVVRGKK